MTRPALTPTQIDARRAERYGELAAEPVKRVMPTGPTLASRYRCRDHPDYPVTWRGTGCIVCERDQQAASRGNLPNWRSE